MIIRLANAEDIVHVQNVYDEARKYMKENNNPSQWSKNYPNIETLRADYYSKSLYVCLNNLNEVVGVFTLSTVREPNYEEIVGQWSYDLDYSSLHRIASNNKEKGIFKNILDYVFSVSDYLRIDTHQNNQTMLNLMDKYHFNKCGIVKVSDGTERIAFDLLKKDYSKSF